MPAGPASAWTFRPGFPRDLSFNSAFHCSNVAFLLALLCYDFVTVSALLWRAWSSAIWPQRKVISARKVSTHAPPSIVLLDIADSFPYSAVMPKTTLNVLAVIGSLHRDSVTRVVVARAARQLADGGCDVDLLDLEKEPLPLYNPDTSHDLPEYAGLQGRVERADVIVLGTPDYHGSISSTLKNFLDHFWHEFAGKLFATIVASHEKGLTVTDQLRTVARQCYAWTLPYGVSFSEDDDVKDGEITSEALQRRLEMLVRDVLVYGALLARQRQADLEGDEPGFLARHRNQ